MRTRCPAGSKDRFRLTFDIAIRQNLIRKNSSWELISSDYSGINYYNTEEWQMIGFQAINIWTGELKFDYLNYDRQAMSVEVARNRVRYSYHCGYNIMARIDLSRWFPEIKLFKYTSWIILAEWSRNTLNLHRTTDINHSICYQLMLAQFRSKVFPLQ